MQLLNVTEAYQIQQTLMDILLSENKDKYLDSFIENGFDVSKDEVREIFESEVADRKALKQDYTPNCLCELVSALAGKQSKVLDVCCGVGSLSLKNDCEWYYMEEISDMSISLALLNMAIRNKNAIIQKKNVLTREVHDTYKLERTDKYSSITKIADTVSLDEKYDCVISNPPYSLKWSPENDERFWGYELAPKSKADYAFILDSLYRLSEKGKAFIILPHGVLFRGAKEGETRKALIHDNVIDSVIGLPEGLFLNTSIPVIVLVLNKHKKDKNVLFVDASKDYEKVGKQNALKKEHIEKIVTTFRERKSIDKYAKLATFEEIENNSFNLNIPRYVDTFEEPEPIDYETNLMKMIELENEKREIDIELADMLKDLNGPYEYIQYRDGIVEMLKDDTTTHSISNMCKNVELWIINNQRILAERRKVNIYEVADFERSKKGKKYNKGSILIQISATKGQLVYLNESQEVDSKYGVFIPKGVYGKYLYYMLEMEMPNFLKRYQTGLNIAPEVFKHLDILVHTNEPAQRMIASALDVLQTGIQNLIKEKEWWEEFKKIHLDGMFI